MFDVITIGSATKDIYISSPKFKRIKNKSGFISGEALCVSLGSKIDIGEPAIEIGGRGVNTAITFSRQGFKTTSLIAAGKDESAKILFESLKKERVSTIPFISATATTAYSLIFLAKGGERTILTYPGALAQDINFPKILKKSLKQKRVGIKWAYLAAHKLNSPVTTKIINQLHAKGILIAVNSSRKMIPQDFKKILPILKKTRVFILNREEAACLTGLPFGKKKEIFKKIDDVVGGIFVMTDGINGTWVSDNSYIFEINAFKARTIDETGAGDAFGAGFIAGLMRKKESAKDGKCKRENLIYALRLGSANAASVVEKIGGTKGILTRKQFENNKRWKKFKIKIHKL